MWKTKYSPRLVCCSQMSVTAKFVKMVVCSKLRRGNSFKRLTIICYIQLLIASGSVVTSAKCMCVREVCACAYMWLFLMASAVRQKTHSYILVPPLEYASKVLLRAGKASNYLEVLLAMNASSFWIVLPPFFLFNPSEIWSNSEVPLGSN